VADGTQDFRVGECRLDLDRGTLSCDGALVPLRAKAFALLGHLARNAGRVVSKDELLERVWPDVIVTEDSLTQAIRDVRRAIGDERQEIVRTVARRGYLLAVPPAPLAPAGAAGQPRVAVLPFGNPAGDEGDGILVDGLVEEITNGLARFRSVTVIARHSAFAFRPEEGASPEAVAARLGADYLVEGSARRTGGRFIVMAALADANGRRLWGEGFDCAAGELLSLQQVIPRRIIPRLVGNIEDSVLARTSAAPTASLSAFEHFTRGVALLRSYGDGVNERGREHLLRAIGIDPGFGLAHAYLALAETMLANYGRAPREVLLAAKARATTAIGLSPGEARCHRILGMLRHFLGEYAAAEAEVRTAFEINPHDADALATMGFVLTDRGRAAEALDWIDRAMALNPLHPAFYFVARSMALYQLGRYDEAAGDLGRLPRLNGRLESRMAATLAMAGRAEEAAPHLDRAEAMDPGWTRLAEARDFYRFERDEELEHLLTGIRAALEWRARARGGPAATDAPPGR
jgi:TolB-like protein/DNA-binding winged helix-turn-helix (wHTH) protein